MRRRSSAGHEAAVQGEHGTGTSGFRSLLDCLSVEDMSKKEEKRVTDHRDRERERRAKKEEDDERRAETERRAEQLREGWRQHHPSEEEREKDRHRKREE